MTGQIADAFHRDGERYAIAAIEKDWPFSPEAEGFRPVSTSSACWRGFHADYGLQSTQLVLLTLHVGLGRVPPPEWRGVAAIRGEWWKYDRTWEYANVRLPIAYSGRIVIARDFIREFYLHMGFQRPYAYQEVKELIFDDGSLLEERDHSAEMARIRERIRAAVADGARGASSPLGVHEFVRSSFSMAYADKWFIQRLL